MSVASYPFKFELSAYCGSPPFSVAEQEQGARGWEEAQMVTWRKNWPCLMYLMVLDAEGLKRVQFGPPCHAAQHSCG